MSPVVLRDSAVVTVTKLNILSRTSKGSFWQLACLVSNVHKIPNIDFVDVALLLHWIY